MISRSLFTAVLVASGAMAGPPLTTIQDVLYKADGTRFAGTLTISWNSFEAIDKSAIATQVTTVTVTGGNLWVQLVPTTTAVPAANYTVVYNSDGQIQFTETWAVPSSTGPLRIRDVRIAQSQTGSVSADSVTPTTQESDVVGLISDLGARPLKGPGYAAGRVAVVDSTGALEGATGNASDCVRVDGSTGPCGGSPPSFVDGETPSGTWTASTPHSIFRRYPTRFPVWRFTATACCSNWGRTTHSTAARFNSSPPRCRNPATHCWRAIVFRVRIRRSAGTSVISPQQIDPTGVTAGQAWIWNGSSYVAGYPTPAPQTGTGQSFACWDATGKLIRSDTACR